MDRHIQSVIRSNAILDWLIDASLNPSLGWSTIPFQGIVSKWSHIVTRFIFAVFYTFRPPWRKGYDKCTKVNLKRSAQAAGPRRHWVHQPVSNLGSISDVNPHRTFHLKGAKAREAHEVMMMAPAQLDNPAWWARRRHRLCVLLSLKRKYRIWHISMGRRRRSMKTIVQKVMAKGKELQKSEMSLHLWQALGSPCIWSGVAEKEKEDGS